MRIDLHMHTTASDGQLAPAALLARVRDARLETISVTDHDTVAAAHEMAALCAGARVTFVPGIEITAIHEGRDVHVLGYGFDPDDAALASFLAGQRAIRVDRMRQIGRRLRALDIHVDVDAILAPVLDRPGRSVGRPAVGRALVAGGHVATLDEAFSRYLGEDGLAWVPRDGASPVDVVAVIRRAGGVASLAHPGQTQADELVAPMVAAGMEAIEVYHPDHLPEVERHYAQLAADLGLVATGGSDYHGDPGHGSPGLGSILVPEAAFEALRARLRS